MVTFMWRREGGEEKEERKIRERRRGDVGVRLENEREREMEES